MAAIPLPARFRSAWIAGPWTDLPFLIGGALAGYALFATHAVLGWDVFSVWLVWYVLSNLPHFFGTYVRTYLDPLERRRRPLLLYGSLAWALAGPLALLASWGLFTAGVVGWHRLPVYGVFIFAPLWAYWHVVRQHYGILRLYQRKNDDIDDARLDAVVLYVGLMAPLIALAVLMPDARHALQLSDLSPGTESMLVTFSAVAVGLVLGVFLVRQLHRWMRGEPINVPKVLLILAAIPLHVLVSFHPAARTAGLLGFASYITVFHDIQYQAIVWHSQQSRLNRPGENRAAHGLAALICSSLPVYLLCAMSMGVGLWYIGCLLNIQPGCTPLIQAAEVGLFAEWTLRELAALTVLGFAMHHYWLDQFIWRPSRDEGLRQELALARSEVEQSGGRKVYENAGGGV